MPPSVYICVYLCASVFELQNKNIPSRDRLNPERLTMPQDVVSNLKQKGGIAYKNHIIFVIVRFSGCKY